MKRQATRPIPIDKTKIRSLAKRVTDAWLNIVKRDRGNSDPVYYMRGADHIMNPPVVEKYMTKDVQGSLVTAPIYITSKFDPKFNPTRFYVYGGFVRSWGYGRQDGWVTRRSFEAALDQSPTWDRIKRELNPQNRKLMFKGIYRALQDAGLNF